MHGQEETSGLYLSHPLLSGSPEAIILVSHKLRVLDANPEGLLFLHVKETAEFGFSLSDCLPELATTIGGWLGYFQESASSQPLQFDYLRRDENSSDSYRIRIIPADGGKAAESDKRKYYVAALKQNYLTSHATASTASLEKITSALPAVLYVFDLQEGKNTFLNHRFEEIMGWNRKNGEINNRYFEENLHPDDARRFPEWLQRWDRAKDGEVYNLQYRLKDTSGRYHWFQTYDTVLSRSVDGRVKEIAGSAFEIDELKEARQELEREKSRLQAIAAKAPVSIMEVDSQGSILYLNRLQFNTGYEMKDIIGYSLFDFVSPQYHLKLEETLERAFRGEEINLEVQGPTQDGRSRWILLRFARIDYSTPGRTDGYHLLVLGEEISQRKEMMERLEALSARAESANRSKTEFFVGLSHDIRTPMNSILGIADLLLRSELNDDQREMAEILRDSSEALLGLLERTLQLSRVELGLLDAARMRRCHLADLVRKCISLFSTEARSRGLALDYSLDPGLPESVICFESGLMQIMVNLLGNAIKYTPSGAVNLRIRPTKDDEVGRATGASEKDLQYLTLEVSDTGPGISPQDLPHVFKLFYQGQEARKMGEGGIGLSGCRRIAEDAGGTIDIISPYPAGGESGTLARLVFPYQKQSESDRPTPFRGRSFDGFRILLVEDNEINQLVARRMLAHLGISAECT
ncbi:MAG: PAS domain S-box protein, partial [Leptospiraceae bacterium]|nr:PAS domain S-box protein [Leptospiraceae bacterium]